MQFNLHLHYYTIYNMDKLKYPIGKFEAPESISDERLQEAIADIGAFPEKIQAAAKLLGSERLARPYRPGGWNGRQVIHHVADSHLNAMIRFKLALTEENPTIKPYREDLWAALADYAAPIEQSLQLITSVHYRWHLLMTSLSDDQWARTFYHPENKLSTTLRRNTLLYQWHGNHHLGHLHLISTSPTSSVKI